MTARQAILKTAQPSYYLVQFDVDECVSIVQRRHLLEPAIPSVADACRVRWSGDEYTARVLAMGDEATVRRAEEEEFLESIMETENQPASKRPRAESEPVNKKPAKKRVASKSSKTPSRKRQVEKKAADFVLCIGSPVNCIPEQQPPPTSTSVPTKPQPPPTSTSVRTVSKPQPPPTSASTLSEPQPPPTNYRSPSSPFSPPALRQPLCDITNTSQYESNHLDMDLSFSSDSESGESDVVIRETEPSKVITVYDQPTHKECEVHTMYMYSLLLTVLCGSGGRHGRRRDNTTLLLFFTISSCCIQCAETLNAVVKLALSLTSIEEKVDALISSVSEMKHKQSEHRRIEDTPKPPFHLPVSNSQKPPIASTPESATFTKMTDGILPVPIDPDTLVKLRHASSSRRNFAANLMRKIFGKAEREVSNVRGKLGKSQLDPDKIDYIKTATFRMYPLDSKESSQSAWAACINAIDEANRRLYRKK